MLADISSSKRKGSENRTLKNFIDKIASQNNFLRIDNI